MSRRQPGPDPPARVLPRTDDSDCDISTSTNGTGTGTGTCSSANTTGIDTNVEGTVLPDFIDQSRPTAAVLMASPLVSTTTRRTTATPVPPIPPPVAVAVAVAAWETDAPMALDNHKRTTDPTRDPHHHQTHSTIGYPVAHVFEEKEEPAKASNTLAAVGTGRSTVRHRPDDHTHAPQHRSPWLNPPKSFNEAEDILPDAGSLASSTDATSMMVQAGGDTGSGGGERTNENATTAEQSREPCRWMQLGGGGSSPTVGTETTAALELYQRRWTRLGGSSSVSPPDPPDCYFSLSHTDIDDDDNNDDDRTHPRSNMPSNGTNHCSSSSTGAPRLTASHHGNKLLLPTADATTAAPTETALLIQQHECLQDQSRIEI